jgi:carboxyl-terminal processing protease
VVGERTFGLASEQKLITIPDGSALILTVANYYNGGGKSILEEGVTPAEVVRQEATAQDDGADDEDSSANAAQTTAPAEPKPLSPEDAVFKKAVELLKTPAKKAA